MSESARINWALAVSRFKVNEHIIPQNARVKNVKKINLFFMVLLFCCKVGGRCSYIFIYCFDIDYNEYLYMRNFAIATVTLKI